MEASNVRVGYIPRVGTLEPRIRLIVQRKVGSGVVEIRSSALAEVCPLASESSLDVIAAFRACLPALKEFLTQIFADMPPGSVTVVTKDRAGSQLVAERHGSEPVYYQPRARQFCCNRRAAH